MNALVSGLPRTTYYDDTPFVVFRRLGDFNRGSPSDTYVLLDEREDSINDGAFYVDLMDFDQPDAWAFLNSPAAYHNRSGAFTFADGHSSFHRWIDSRTYQPIRPGIFPPGPRSPDIRWLLEHASVRK